LLSGGGNNGEASAVGVVVVMIFERGGVCRVRAVSPLTADEEEDLREKTRGADAGAGAGASLLEAESKAKLGGNVIAEMLADGAGGHTDVVVEGTGPSLFTVVAVPDPVGVNDGAFGFSDKAG
jgi:hypothetical protein